jgi:hypothetical protein
MSLTDTDRRRLIAATVLTLVALPALWWANTSERSAGPSLAVAGLDADAATVAGDIATPTAADDRIESDDEVSPVFLEGPSSPAGADRPEIAVPAKPLLDGITAKATFRSSVGVDECIAPGITSGTQITVINLANNRSMTCTTLLAPGTATGELVMHTSVFTTIADLTDAPIAVEIRR